MIYNLVDIKGSLGFALAPDEKIKGNNLAVTFLHLALKLYETRNSNIRMNYSYTIATPEYDLYSLKIDKRTFINKKPDSYIVYINDADLKAIFGVLSDFDQLLIQYKRSIQ